MTTHTYLGGTGLSGDNGSTVLGADQMKAGFGLIGTTFGIFQLVLVSSDSLQVLHGHSFLKTNIAI